MVTLAKALKTLRESGKPSCMYFDPQVMELETFQSKIETSKLMKGRIIVTSEVDLTTMLLTKGMEQPRVYTVMQFAEDYTQIERISKPGEFRTLREALDYAKLKGEGG